MNFSKQIVNTINTAKNKVMGGNVSVLNKVLLSSGSVQQNTTLKPINILSLPIRFLYRKAIRINTRQLHPAHGSGDPIKSGEWNRRLSLSRSLSRANHLCERYQSTEPTISWWLSSTLHATNTFTDLDDRQKRHTTIVSVRKYILHFVFQRPLPLRRSFLFPISIYSI